MLCVGIPLPTELLTLRMRGTQSPPLPGPTPLPIHTVPLYGRLQRKSLVYAHKANVTEPFLRPVICSWCKMTRLTFRRVNNEP
jgi:hypothetical protein